MIDLLAASQTVKSGRGPEREKEKTAPIPLTIVSTMAPLGARTEDTAVVLRMSPWMMVRLFSSVFLGTELERRSLLREEGVRATAKMVRCINNLGMKESTIRAEHW